MPKEPRIPIFVDHEEDPHWLVHLTQGQMTKISCEDIDRVKCHNWCASFGSRSKKWYALRRTKKKAVRLHHFILDIPPGTIGPGMAVDHINGDSLDNRRENLEVVTQRENMLRAPGWTRKKEEPCL